MRRAVVLSLPFIPMPTFSLATGAGSRFRAMLPVRKLLYLRGMKTITLFRPVNATELALIKDSGYTAFPPRLPDQPIFYPVCNFEYARQITVEWNLPAYGNGYVTAFDVAESYLSRYEIQNVGGEIHNEYWIPSEDLEEFNRNIQGPIRVVFEAK